MIGCLQALAGKYTVLYYRYTYTVIVSNTAKTEKPKSDQILDTYVSLNYIHNFTWCGRQ